MGKILILNGSPRAPKSNSKQYADIFAQKCKWATKYSCITSSNHLNLLSELNHLDVYKRQDQRYKQHIAAGYDRQKQQGNQYNST